MLETRVKAEKFKKVSSLIFRDWSVINNNDDAAANGRIWIDWNPKIWDIKSCASCAQAIHCKVVHLESNICFNLIDVYAFNTQEQRKRLWKFFNDTCNKTYENLLIGGGFINVSLVYDRLNGNPVNQLEIQDFADCLLMNTLSEVKTIGDYYTWCNNQARNYKIYSKIDRFLSNTS